MNTINKLDVSCHPISLDEIRNWYFNPLIYQNNDEIRVLPKNLQERHQKIINKNKNVNSELIPLNLHFEAIASIQGLFREFYYFGNHSLSYIIDAEPAYKKYFIPWQRIIPATFVLPEKNPQRNYIGSFLSAENIKFLLVDLESSDEVYSLFTGFYPNNKIKILIKMLTICAENNLGLIETNQIIKPNPINLESSFCHSNLLNCNLYSLQIYQKHIFDLLRKHKKFQALNDEKLITLIKKENISFESYLNAPKTDIFSRFLSSIKEIIS